MMTDLGWTDNCDGSGTVTGSDQSDGNTCPETITRTWTYTDACNNTSSVTQTITIGDQTPPVFASPPADVSVECIGDVPVMTDLGWTDNCDGSGTVTGSDQSDGNTCPETITRTWTYTDACNNTSSVTQTITIGDQTPPVFASPPADVSVECIGDVPVMTDLGWTDNCDGSGTVTGSDQSDGNTCPETITRTWTYTDACNNASSVTQTITIGDQTPPVFASPPADVSVECIGDVPVMTDLGWTDNCDGSGTVTGSDQSDGNTCPETITRTWTYTDACNNASSVTQTITIGDQTPPVFASPPADVSVECIGDVPVMTDLGWTDNCDGSGTVTGSDQSDGNTCPETITRTWTYTDACNNASSVTQTITIGDQTPPVFASPPADVSVECIGDVPAMTDLGWTDNCDGSGTVTGSDQSDGNTCPETITRTWTYTDACNNASSVTQTITIGDQTPPVFASPPADVSVECIGDVPAITDLGWTDNCDGSGTVTGSDQSDGNTCPETITRTWTYTDACNNTSSVTQTITIGDQTPPVFASPPADVSVECIGDVPVMTDLGWTDNCDGSGTVTGSDQSDGNTCPETITRTWTYTDACNNTSSVTQTITIGDQTPPVFASPPADVSVECIGDVPAMTDLGWTDNCDGSGTVTGSDQSDGNTCPETITRTWTYTDACNNASSVTQTITIGDQTPPVFASPPADVSVECIGDVPAITDLGWTDNCDGSGTVTGSDQSDGNTCPETITRTWTYTDACNNTSSVTQTITIGDQTPPVFASPPADVSVECIGDVPAMTDLGWTDNCDGSGTVTGSDQSDGNTCPETITRTWTYTDACNNTSSVTQTITIGDQTPPVFASPPADVSVECIGDVPVMTDLGWTDNCDGSGTVTGSDQSDGNTCPETITRTWTYTDACNNTSSVTQTITIGDQTPPVFASPPADVSVECIGDVPAMTDLGWTDNCDGSGTVTGSDQSDGNTCPETITRTWTYTDACNNASSVTQTITIGDQTPPVFASPPADVSVECIGDVPVMTDLGWTDNCDGSGTVTGSDQSDGNTCPETITRTWTYTDACNNASSVTQTITIGDQTPPVFASPPADVSVECIGDVPVMTDLGWTDNCDGSGTVTGSDQSDGNTCPETITRTWTYTDACNNTSSVTQTITIGDQTPPVFASPPADVSVECIGDVPVMTDLGWTDNCDGSGTVTGSDQSDGNTCPETITRTWTYTDACNNASSVTQTITIGDQTPPVFASPPADVSVECIGDVPVMTDLGWTDNCDGSGTVTGRSE